MTHDEELRQLRLENARLRALLQEATLDNMGGKPDVFAPEEGWDKWDRRVTDALNGKGALRKAASR